MKRAILIALSLMAVCGIILAGTVSAAKEGYGFGMFSGADVVWDGQVDPATEWDDSFKDWLYDGWTQTSSFYRCKWGSAPAVCENWLMEFLGDTTDDAGDWWEIDVDNNADGGGPNADDFKVNWTAADGVKVWQGTGTGWTAFATANVANGGDVFAATSVSASPASATAHRIVEIYLDKGVTSGGVLAMGLDNNARLAIYDASTGKTLMWPPESNGDQPDTYGAGTTDISGGVIPEGLTIGVMLSLSTIAVIVGTRYFKKPKI